MAQAAWVSEASEDLSVRIEGTDYHLPSFLPQLGLSSAHHCPSGYGGMHTTCRKRAVMRMSADSPSGKFPTTRVPRRFAPTMSALWHRRYRRLRHRRICRQIREGGHLRWAVPRGMDSTCTRFPWWSGKPSGLQQSPATGSVPPPFLGRRIYFYTVAVMPIPTM